MRGCVFFGLGIIQSVFGLRLWNSGTCPYAQRTWIALEEVGVEYQMEKVDLQNKSQDFVDKYTEANPGGRAKVPVLEVDDFTLTESIPCTQYIFDTYSKKEDSSKEKAQARLAVEVHPFNYFQLLRLRNDPEALADAVSDLGANMKYFDTFLNTCSKEGPFIFGTHFSFADACIAPFVQRSLITLRFFIDVDLLQVCSLRNAPRTLAYIEALINRPSVKATGTDADSLIESTKAMLLRFDSASAKSS